MSTSRKSAETEGKFTLGVYLTNLRAMKRMTLREVEDATNRDVSNAYLSQLEKGKIRKPSPNILHSLAKAYGVQYELLMEKAGYLENASSSSPGGRHGRVATFADEHLTNEEEEELLEYLAFLRVRRKKNNEA